MTREQKLVVLDSRFIHWLSHSGAVDLSKRYVLVHETQDNEVTITCLDKLTSVEEDIIANIGDQATGSNWQFAALFDTQGRGREMVVGIKTVVSIK